MDYVELADYYAEQYGLDPVIFRRMIMQESGFDPEARNERSGALGIAQIMEDSARQPGFGIDPIEDRLDPEQSLRFGAQYLRAMLDRYDGDYARALAAYNAGPTTVDRAGGIPDIAETQTYVRNILGSEDIERLMGAMSAQGVFSTPEGLAMLREERDPEAGMRMVYEMLQQRRAQEAAVQAPTPTAQVQPGRGFREGGSVEGMIFQTSLPTNTMAGRHPQDLGYMAPRQEDFGPRPAIGSALGNLTPLSTSFTPIKMASSAEPSEALGSYGEYLNETYVEPMQQKVEDFVSGIQNNEQRMFGNGAMGIGGLAGFRPPQTLGEVQRYPMVAQGPVGPFMGRIPPNMFVGYPQSQLRSGIGGLGTMM